MNVIEVDKLNKRFGKVKALTDVSFSVPSGTVTGFLGPNGAGKSTTMNILMGFIKPDSGKVKIFNETVTPNLKARNRIGFLSSNMSLDRTLTIEQELCYFAKLSGVSPRYGLSLAKGLKLDTKSKIRNLSTGNHQKVALIVALLAKPKLLVLDEPTNGLDPLVQTQFNKLIHNLTASGTTVFISSHILSEVSELCEHFIFIKKGKIVAKVTKDELLSQASETITIKSTPENLKLLKTNKVGYKVEAANLEKVFMSYYEETQHD